MKPLTAGHDYITVVTDQTQSVVLQDRTDLSPNSDSGGEYPLLDFSSALTVSAPGNEQNETIQLSEDTSPLIFKLRKNWKGDGRQAKHMSNGYYVVFAPCTWHRKGAAPAEPSRSADSEFSAHYFYADGNGEPDGFDKCSSFSQQRRFLLKGVVVVDDSDMGDLFVGSAPELTDANNWDGVSWVRVGEEGSRGWDKNFKPAEKNLATVLENREGWFYARIYDGDVKMIDGFAFRRLMNLEAILVNERPFSPENIITPDPSGYTATTLQFSGKIQVKSDNPHITVSDDNTAIVAPNPGIDKTQWTLIGDHGQAEVCIHLPRIWWRININNAGDEASEWRDTAFDMSREGFRSSREATIIVRLPPAAREYPAAKGNNKDDTAKQAEFRLREFCDLKQISESSPIESALQIKYGEEVCTIIRIAADAPPPPPLPPPPEPKKMYRPTNNKGFSLSELTESGLTEAEVKHLRIAVDRRRKTKHCANTDRLKHIQQGENHAD